MFGKRSIGDKMTQEKHKIIYLKDYSAPDYRIETVELHFDLGEESTRVLSLLKIVGNFDRERGVRPLVLDGRELRLTSERTSSMKRGSSSQKSVLITRDMVFFHS